MASLPRHALVIEDEMLIALELETLLQELGYQTVDIADSPEDALASALAHRPDLMTADVRIIGGTGIEAVKAIHAKLGPIPFVYVTGNIDMLGDETAAVVVDKPISARALAAACAKATA
jgi:CheY-like chemotaxis protein